MGGGLFHLSRVQKGKTLSMTGKKPAETAIRDDFGEIM